MAICPQCKEEIDNDSCFCDQCGSELYVCSNCHIIGKGKGKRCGQCGNELVPASSLANGSVETVNNDNNTANNSCGNANIANNSYNANAANNSYGGTNNPYGNANVANNPYNCANNSYGGGGYNVSNGYGVQNNVNFNNDPSCLVCRSENIRLPLIDNAVIGRNNGNYPQELSGLIYMSRIHARLNLNGKQWSITDLNSRNGTKVNGVTCMPTLNFTKGDIVRIANVYDFIVE